ncbi:hypothetical protein IRT45_05710 [Nocardia sp. BSTN01]|uniref:hypothetical protein n=1 Tax=Nocardia sp. BSTN01 TaxID=2783665 RepID=UPI00188EDD7B|nr:hypothetical protein [Nocardia sp. BSTN01]MBF4996650.1 hypothetical protein [Nocardia sp. BSTN01]
MAERFADPATEQWLREVERSMRGIERSVMDEVHLGPVAVRILLAAAGVATLSLTAAAPTAVAATRPLLPGISIVISVAAVGTAVRAVLARRFPWMCAGAMTAGLATVVSLLSFWSLRTGGGVLGAGWFALTAVGEGVLAAGWVAAVVRPVSSSQPDCRIAPTGRR